MNGPVMLPPQQVAPDTVVLPSYFPIPGLGVLPIHSFLIRGAEPVLVDTGLAALRTEYLEQLRSMIDVADLRWIWITHADADHIGNLAPILAEATQARVVTTFLGLGKLGLHQIAVESPYLLNPGQSLDLGDRKLVAMRPPTYDAPETTGFLDTATRILFTADSFGALLEEPAETASDIGDGLRSGLVTWATIDAPWLGSITEIALADSLRTVRDLDPSAILSSHLPPARGMNDRLLSLLGSAAKAPAFVGPDQAALESMTTAAGASR